MGMKTGDLGGSVSNTSLNYKEVFGYHSMILGGIILCLAIVYRAGFITEGLAMGFVFVVGLYLFLLGASYTIFDSEPFSRNRSVWAVSFYLR